MVKNYTPFSDQELPLKGSAVFHAVPALGTDVLAGQELSINGHLFTGKMVATNQTRSASGRLCSPTRTATSRPWTLYFESRVWVDKISTDLGVPLRGKE